MEFTLEQLSPDNVTSLFDGAYYKAETNRVRNQEDETEVAVTTTVWSDGRPVCPGDRRRVPGVRETADGPHAELSRSGHAVGVIHG